MTWKAVPERPSIPGFVGVHVDGQVQKQPEPRSLIPCATLVVLFTLIIKHRASSNPVESFIQKSDSLSSKLFFGIAIVQRAEKQRN
jgi:hypothetical protein